MDEIADMSPTLTQNIESLQADGWVLAYGEADGGSFCDRQAKRIVVDPNETDPEEVAQTLAHETGHALYELEPYIGQKGLTREQYVARNANRHLKDEGEATMTNARIRDEIIAAGGPDIGIAGAEAERYAEIAKRYTDPADRDKARQEIADIFARDEHPSTDVTKTYADFYGEEYGEWWDEDHARP